MTRISSPDISFSPAPDSKADVAAHSDAIWQHPHADSARMRSWAEEAKQLHAQHQHVQHVVVIGTGGSTLGAKMLSVFGTTPDRVLFAETVDVHSVQTTLDKIQLEQTLFIVTSKSGSTIETLSLYALFAKHYAPEELSKHFLFISDPKDSPLRKLAEKFDISVAEHPSDIGGRYSIFTIVGLLPALFAGVDIDAFIDGAAGYKEQGFWEQTTAWHLARHQEGKAITVMLPYLDRLYHYTYWWRQLWAESLGKDGHFTTPFASIGSVDQHSQLQLWLDGKKNKSFTLISVDEGEPMHIDAEYLPADIYPYVSGLSTEDIQHALVDGTIHSLKQAGLPVCHIHFKQFGAAELGLLVMHGLAEITALAACLKINPFDQPAVEIGKSKAKELLGNKREEKPNAA